MKPIKGEKFQLAGFDIKMRGSHAALSEVFAVFCGINENPNRPCFRNLGKVMLLPQEQRPQVRSLDATRLMSARVFFNALPETTDTADTAYVHGADVARDLGLEKLDQVLRAMMQLPPMVADEGKTSVFLPARELREP